MPQIEVRPVRSSNVKEREAAELCLNRSFSKDPNNPNIQGFFRQFRYYPMASEEMFWAVFENGKPVAGLMLVPFNITIDMTTFQVVGLTGVGTDQNYRHKGYASRLLEKVHEYLQNYNFHGAVLHSAADILYQKAGYDFAACAWDAQCTCKTEQYQILSEKIAALEPLVGTSGTQFHIDFITAGDYSRTLGELIFNIRATSPRFFSRRVRISLGFERFNARMKERLDIGAILGIIYQKNEPKGYVLVNYQQHNLELIDFYTKYSGIENELFLLRMLSGLLEEYQETFCTLIMRTYSEDKDLHKITKILNGLVSTKMLVGNMAIFFDPAVILAAMQPTFSFRLQSKTNTTVIPQFLMKVNTGSRTQNFTWHLFNGLLSICPISPNERESSENQSGKMPTVTITAKELTILVYGYVPVRELLENCIDSDNEEEILNTLELLFPPLNPVWDYFENY